MNHDSSLGDSPSLELNRENSLLLGNIRFGVDSIPPNIKPLRALKSILIHTLKVKSNILRLSGVPHSSDYMVFVIECLLIGLNCPHLVMSFCGK